MSRNTSIFRAGLHGAHRPEPVSLKNGRRYQSRIAPSAARTVDGVDDFLPEGMLRRGGFVHLDAEARCVRRAASSRLRSDERVLHHLPAPRHVGQHVFLDQEVRRAQGEMQRGGVGDRAQRIVRRHAHRVQLSAMAAIFFASQQPAAMAQVGLDDVAACFSKISRNSWRVTSRSPVAMGTGLARRTSAITSTFSGGTGSSMKYGRIRRQHAAEFDGISQ